MPFQPLAVDVRKERLGPNSVMNSRRSHGGLRHDARWRTLAPDAKYVSLLTIGVCFHQQGVELVKSIVRHELVEMVRQVIGHAER